MGGEVDIVGSQQAIISKYVKVKTFILKDDKNQIPSVISMRDKHFWLTTYLKIQLRSDN